jgi:hypothetical protein
VPVTVDNKAVKISMTESNRRICTPQFLPPDSHFRSDFILGYPL